MSYSLYQRRNKMDPSENNQWLPTTLAKSTPSPLGGDNNEVATKQVSVESSIPDQVSETMNNAASLSQSCDLNDNSSFGISTPEKPIPLRPNSQVYAKPLSSTPPQEGDNEIVTQNMADPINDLVTTTNETLSFPQCGYDLNAKFIEPLLVFQTPASRDKKRKASGQKKKKIYWPKVKGQIKRKTTPKVPSKTKRPHVSMVNGDNKKYKRNPKSKSGKKSNDGASSVNGKDHIISKKGPLHSKRGSCKRSLTFEPGDGSPFKGDQPLILELEENSEKELNELGFKGDFFPIMKKKPHGRINLSCPLLIQIREMKLKTPMQKRSKIRKKRIQKQELKCHWNKKRKRSYRHKGVLAFQWNKMQKRSYHRKRKINLGTLIICYPDSSSHIGVEEKKTTKRKTMKRMKKEEPATFVKDIVPKQEFGKWEIREGRKALDIMTNFAGCALDEVNEANDEREGKIRRRMTIPSKEMKYLIKKFQSLSMTSHKNKDRRLVTYKSQDLYRGKVKLDLETLNEWNILMNGKPRDENEDTKRYWEQERSLFSTRVDAFIARMHNFLGNRSFSPWKGSALDSVIGVFLTQNVSDHLSSSAYMSLASTFPIKSSSEEGENNIPLLKHERSCEAFATNNTLNLGKGKLYSPGIVFGNKKSISMRKKGDQAEQERKLKEEQEAEKKDHQYWESIRREYIQYCTPRNSNHTDSVDWEAVRCADVNKVAKAIEVRGQHNIIAQRIQALLNKLVEMHGSIDLEWLRHAPPHKVKDYLLKVYGLGLKSVECIRLLALEQVAFPVDVNVARIAVRLGWVPLEPLPGSIEFHMLDQYPPLDMVQQYLWPRLCTLNQQKLYQLHYHLITFGKVFCTKKRPNCKACPMRAECKHFASAIVSPTFALPQNNADKRQNNGSMRSDIITKYLEGFSDPLVGSNVNVATSPTTKQCEPIIDLPESPRTEDSQSEIEDIEESCTVDDYFEEFATLKLDKEHSKTEDNYFELNDMESSNAVVAHNPNTASKFMQEMKIVARLRTKRMVYVLPDDHPLLHEFPKREPDDPSNYLLVIWIQGELKEEPCEATQNQSNCSNNHGSSCNKIRKEGNRTVSGTILVPCRTATNGRFPLNGTYFQVNEVFADADSSSHPIDVSTSLLWNLNTRIAYFGTSTTNIIRNSLLEEIQECFWKGFLCVRGWDRNTGAARPLSYRFHCKIADQLIMKKKRKIDDQDLKGKQSKFRPQRDDLDF